MEIKFLGTGAYEGVPSLFCECPVCKNALKVRGKEIRTRLQTLINDDLLIDFNGDTVSHFQKNKIDSTKISDILITHTHSDHFVIHDLVVLTDIYSKKPADKVINIYGGQSMFDQVSAKASEPYNNFSGHLHANLVEHAKVIEVGKYKVLPIKATHAPKTCPFIYIIDDGEKVILYGHDTGLFTEEMYDAIKGYGKKFDLVTLDCNFELMKHEQCWNEDSHMCVDGVLLTIAKLTELGVVDNNTVKIINHFSHNSGSTHRQMVNAVKKHNLVVAYDGMKIDL